MMSRSAVEELLDDCWPRYKDNTPYDRIGALEVDEFVSRVERKLGILFTPQEHHKLNELFKYKPRVGVKRQDILKLLTRVGKTISAYMESDHVDHQPSPLLPEHALGLIERTASYLLGRNRAARSVHTPKEEAAVSRIASQISIDEQEIERLQNHVESLERLILFQSTDPNVSDLLKLGYNNSRRIAILENIRDEQAATIREYQEREFKVEQLLEKVALQNQMIEKLQQRLNETSASQLKKTPSSSGELFLLLSTTTLTSKDAGISSGVYNWPFLLSCKNWNMWWVLVMLILLPYSVMTCVSLIQCVMGPAPCKIQYSWLLELPFLDYCVYTIQTHLS